MRLRRLEPVLRRALRGPCRLPMGSRVLVAVSGGADSSALLAAFASVAGEFGLELTAAHLHHGLRGADADADLAHVRELCERLAVPLLAARWDCRARMRREGFSGEDGLRRLRRRYLLAAANRAGAAAIATAHTADDQLETVLMRLARGTGLAGLGGMRPRHGRWLKPLLEATRMDAEHDLARARIAWREDASNAERTWLRNRVRLDVVPALLAAVSGTREPSAGARAALARRAAATAADARAGARVVGRLAARVLARRVSTDSAGVASIDSRRWAALPVAVRHSVLARLWKSAAPHSSGLPRRHRDALDALLTGGRRVAELAMPEGGRAALSAGRLSMSATAPRRSPGTRGPGPGHRAAGPDTRGPAPKVRAPAGRKARASNRPADARLRPTSARRARPGPARSHARAGVPNRRRARSTTVSR